MGSVHRDPNGDSTWDRSELLEVSLNQKCSAGQDPWGEHPGGRPVEEHPGEHSVGYPVGHPGERSVGYPVGCTVGYPVGEYSLGERAQGNLGLGPPRSLN